MNPEKQPSGPQTRLFLVRVWKEPGALERGWRASMKQMKQGEEEHKVYFANTDDLLEHLYHEFNR